MDNPVSLVDPFGLDVTIVQYRGGALNPGDHIGIGVNSEDTYGFYPEKDSVAVAAGVRVRGAVKFDDGEVIRKLIIKTTPKQDELIKKYIEDRRSNPGKYSLYGRNCARFVESALEAGGVDAPTDFLPPTAWDKLRDKYQPIDLRTFFNSILDAISEGVDH